MIFSKINQVDVNKSRTSSLVFTSLQSMQDVLMTLTSGGIPVISLISQEKLSQLSRVGEDSCVALPLLIHERGKFCLQSCIAK